MDASTVSQAFGQTLRTLRKAAQMTQEQLGLDADLQRNYVSELELGQKQPSVTTLFKLARALDVAPSHFVELMDVELAGSPKRKKTLR